ncbi:MAG: hypothetical protein GTO41_17915 [Burkholderiales bacterium]|nr:hypothetical protein [Burkholderiales bacterium]
MQWTREDEIRNGYYHTASAHVMKAGLDSSGKVIAWKHSGSWPSILALWNPQQKTGFSIEYGLGMVDVAYNNVPNIRIENGEADVHDPGRLVPVGEQHPALVCSKLLRL